MKLLLILSAILAVAVATLYDHSIHSRLPPPICGCEPAPPICASNWVTYRGECDMGCHQYLYKEKLYVIYLGPCEDLQRGKLGSYGK